MPRIKDFSKQYTLDELESLSDFVEQELRLSSPIELAWLDAIEIRDLGPNTYGDWCGRYDGQTFKAIIRLNSLALGTIEQLKRTLAHEYGHHWTLSYLAVHHNLRIYEERLPRTYYKIRGLSEEHCIYSPQQIRTFEDWMRCDKEIIAEDYRVLFSPHPHNQDHRMVGNLPLIRLSAHPSIREQALNIWRSIQNFFYTVFKLG
ncbi:MAG: hypothetical protein ACKPKF_05425, partial [Microcystis panniformis]